MAFFSFVRPLVLFSLFPFSVSSANEPRKKKTAFWMETMCRIQFVYNFCNFSFDIMFARFTIKAAKLLIWETYKCWIVKNDEQKVEPMTEYWMVNQPILWSVLCLSFIIIKHNKQSKLINKLKHVLYSLHSLPKKELETCFWRIFSFYAKWPNGMNSKNCLFLSLSVVNVYLVIIIALLLFLSHFCCLQP